MYIEVVTISWTNGYRRDCIESSVAEDVVVVVDEEAAKVDEVAVLGGIGMLVSVLHTAESNRAKNLKQ